VTRCTRGVCRSYSVVQVLLEQVPSSAIRRRHRRPLATHRRPYPIHARSHMPIRPSGSPSVVMEKEMEMEMEKEKEMEMEMEMVHPAIAGVR
jgi:hypothetical protein